MLRRVWTRLRDRLSSLDSSTSMVEVTTAYAAHFTDMYVDKHTGKHMTGDRVRILLLILPFLLRDLIAPEVQRKFSPVLPLHTIQYSIRRIIQHRRSSLSMILLHLLVLDRLCTGWDQSKIPVTRLSRCTWLLSNGIFFSVALGWWQQTWRGCRAIQWNCLTS